MDTKKDLEHERTVQEVFPKLSQREKEVVKCIQEGKTNREIAKILDIKPNTVKSHVSKILRKLKAGNRTLAAMKAAVFNCLD